MCQSYTWVPVFVLKTLGFVFLCIVLIWSLLPFFGLAFVFGRKLARGVTFCFNLAKLFLFCRKTFSLFMQNLLRNRKISKKIPTCINFRDIVTPIEKNEFHIIHKLCFKKATRAALTANVFTYSGWCVINYFPTTERVVTFHWMNFPNPVYALVVDQRVETGKTIGKGVSRHEILLFTNCSSVLACKVFIRQRAEMSIS